MGSASPSVKRQRLDARRPQRRRRVKDPRRLGGTSRASSPPSLRSVTSPASSLHALRRSGPVESCPAGPATREESRVEAAGIEPAVAVTWPVRVAPGPRVGARLEWAGGDPAAPGRQPGAPQPPPELRQSAARRPLCRAAGRRARSRLTPSRPAAPWPARPLRHRRPGPQGPALAVPARSPWASQGGACARSPTRPGRGERLRGRLGDSAPLWGCATPPGRPLRRKARGARLTNSTPCGRCALRLTPPLAAYASRLAARAARLAALALRRP